MVEIPLPQADEASNEASVVLLNRHNKILVLERKVHYISIFRIYRNSLHIRKKKTSKHKLESLKQQKPALRESSRLRKNPKAKYSTKIQSLSLQFM